MTRRLPDLKRRPPNKIPKQKFILFCEGKNTEPSYFEALAKICNSTLIEVRTEKAVGTPFTIAEAAVAEIRKRKRSRKDSYEENDNIWAVFDRDEHPKFEEATRLCAENLVEVARSNRLLKKSAWLANEA